MKRKRHTPDQIIRKLLGTGSVRTHGSPLVVADEESLLMAVQQAAFPLVERFSECRTAKFSRRHQKKYCWLWPLPASQWPAGEGVER